MNWLFSKRHDLLILYAPVWICWIGAFLLPDRFHATPAPLWIWVLFVLGIDVSHVWSSIFRTYLDKEEFSNHRRLLIWAPVLSFLGAATIASISVALFWRILAYVAVYHFIKQQYGFMRIYKAKKGDFGKQLITDNFVIYLSMLYPVLFWHLTQDRQFAWFVEGDFVMLNTSAMSGSYLLVGNLIYLLLGVCWLLQEILRKAPFAWGKVLWIATTFGNWYLGIIYFNSDIIFTITNVVAHGVPYMALIIFYQQRKLRIQKVPITAFYPLLVIGAVLLLAMAEEYFWDIWLNHEHASFFGKFLPYWNAELSTTLMVLATALLAVPQITHYIIDGFIWKNNVKNPYLKKILLNQ